MSFLESKSTIEEGHTVIVYKSKLEVLALKVKSGEVLQVKNGAIPHSNLVGVPYGSKVFTTNGRSFAYVICPSPELWTVTLPHRTQIIYSVDISMATMLLDLKPGCIVCECGTGSGSVSHAFARTIAPDGHLHTFDFHQQRVEIARSEFAAHKLDSIVTVKQCDVCTAGFQLKDIADAVFLDLPEPWRAIDTSKEALKKSGGRICSFSPCIEQVQRTCDKLRECGFVDVETLECLLRPYEVRNSTMVLANLGRDPLEKEVEDRGKGPPSTSVKGHLDMVTAHPLKNISGHTGFLTSATLNPK